MINDRFLVNLVSLFSEVQDSLCLQASVQWANQMAQLLYYMLRPTTCTSANNTI